MADIRKNGNGYFNFGSALSVRADAELKNEVFAQLFNNFTCTASKLTVESGSPLTLLAGDAEIPELSGYEFAIRVTEVGISLVGADLRGFLHGYYTLLEMIEPFCLDVGEERLGIPCVEIWDKPDFEYRMVHYCLFPENELWEMENFLRFSAMLKATHVIVEFWGTLKFDALKELAWENHSYTKDQIRPIFDMARTLGVKIVPMFNHWGHASLSRGRYGKHTVLDQNPRLATLFNHTGWVWNIENPRVKELHRAVRRELVELCGESEFFHIGCDEAYVPKSHEELYPVIEYLSEINGELKGMGRRTVMWGDMLLHKKHFPKEQRYDCNVNDDGVEKVMLDGVPKDIIIADWQYNATEHPFKTSAFLKEKGFELFVCPFDESYSNGACAAKTADELGLLGVIHTTWHTLYKGVRNVSLVLNRAWNRDYDWSDDAMMYVGALYGKANPARGDYERAGWCRQQIGGGY